MRADLHTHSAASDGQYAPAELVRQAKAAGVECLAVTDHDTLDGLDEAQGAGRALGLMVMRGVELGAAEDRHLHILGLNFPAGPSPLEGMCQKLRQGRDERKYWIVDFLVEKGVPIPLEEVEELAGGQIIARPHFARVLVRHGYVASTREAFDKYLDTDEYQRIERFKAPARDCVTAIHDSGGKAVLAHPYQLGFPDEKLEVLIAGLTDAGLDGLECYYPRHTAPQTAWYLHLAEKYGLNVTGGSDFHGEKVKPDVALARWELDLSWLIKK